MKHLALTYILLALVACVPGGQVQRAGLNSDDTGTTTGGTSTAPTDIAWYQNFKDYKRISLYRDRQDNQYLRGTMIENYLIRAADPTASYCLELDFGASVPITDKRYLRVKVAPVSVSSTTTGVKTYYMRADFANPSGSESTCAKDKVQYVDDNNTVLIPYSSVGVSYSVPATCASCTTQIFSTAIKIFSVDSTSGRLVQISPRVIDFSSIFFGVYPGSTPTVGNVCTNSSCSALGYQCCLENQCVNEGQVRNGVDTNSSAFLAAAADVAANSLAFLRYPQFYYICGTYKPPSTTGTPTSGGDDEAAARVKQLQADYACIQHMKATSANTPYLHTPFSPPVTDQSLCNTTDSSSSIYYAGVITRLLRYCRCTESAATLDGLIDACPKWDYAVLTSDSAGLPTQVRCQEFPDSGDTSTTTDAGTVYSVSDRSVPHRFFSTSGAEIDPYATQTSTPTQEGTAFFYSDGVNQLQPNNGTYNMNSVLGSMSVALDQAVPAKVVNVQLDTIYYIATRQGYYSPCPTCGRDSWYSQFFARPATERGNGLVAVGHSTQRDAQDNNTTSGNYEDTVFGRACWVPPTMLPYSQPVGMSSVEAQRQLRLKTQAAMWVNGYQRDWYGFNQGALIGSFDGVSWFAIGNRGRLIRSTTKKLFLAINAPFGDLATNSAHTVSVQPFDNISTGTLLDFDPSLSTSAPKQNAGGTCQSYHQCKVDSDCITQLGWEYVCADVTGISTYWPTFGANDAKENLSIGATAIGPDGMLAQKSIPNGKGGTLRCVYRGAGSICRTDAGNISSSELNKRKLLTCAPNFWCADVDGSNNTDPTTGAAVKVFSREIARYGQPVADVPVSRNHLFGKDTNQLGRPLDYVHTTTGNSSLISNSDAQVTSTLNANVSLIDASASSKVGLCRPGKQLPYDSGSTIVAWNPFVQHQSLDNFSRTDYISQIASCPASYHSTYKYSSCPVLDDDGNYVQQTSAFASLTRDSYTALAQAQNSCGLETLKTVTTLSSYPTADSQQTLSPFKLIEGKPLNSQVITDKTLARDACLRRAGSVCHTDLDCGPNKLHAEQIQYFADTYFGNVPNRKYYEEYLVCGQTDAKPSFSDSNFLKYDMTQNRCCREVGKDITTYTAYEPSGTANGAYDVESSTLDPFVSGTSQPTNVSRYERFQSLANLQTDYPALNAYQERSLATGALSTKVFGSANTGANITTSKQWLTLDKANSKTCCGGGWMRKFTDGTTTWPSKTRLQLDVTNFQCLNYVSPLVGAVDPMTTWGVDAGRLSTELGRYCTDVSGTTGGCAQVQIPIDNSVSTLPTCADTTISSSLNYVGTLAGEVAYSSNIFSFFPPESADSDTNISIDSTVSGGRQNVTVYLPTYAGAGPVTVDVQRRNLSNVLSTTSCTSGSFTLSGPADAGSCGSGCCYSYDSASRKLYVAIAGALSGKYGARIGYQPPGTASPIFAKNTCKDYYYMYNLGQLELAGIPQITHAKLLCNNNSRRVVPGLYDVVDSDSNSTAFDANTFSFISSYTGKRATNYTGLALAPVFAPHDFKCCTPLGRLTKNAATCCSGLGVKDTTQTSGTFYKCMLPAGTDLHVYFNRFVSNEGLNDDLPSGGLAATDFNDQTGEPLSTSTVNNKIAAIGASLCNNTESTKVRRGGAFGNFTPEPLSANSSGQTVYGIVDSQNDVGTLTSNGEALNSGYGAFNSGFRWNHHLYCK